MSLSLLQLLLLNYYYYNAISVAFYFIFVFNAISNSTFDIDILGVELMSFLFSAAMCYKKKKNPVKQILHLSNPAASRNL